MPTRVTANAVTSASRSAGPGFDKGAATEEISEKLTPAIIAMGSARGLGTRRAQFTPYDAADVAFTGKLAEVLADHDDALLAAYVAGETTVSNGQLRDELAAQRTQALVHPVFFGSAITGAGVESLIAGITEFLPPAEEDGNGPVSGTVFKIERGPAGERIAYMRLFSGTVRTRDRLHLGRDDEAKITAISVFDRGAAAPSASLAAGQIGKLWGLGEIQIGDAIGESRTAAEAHHFAPPTLEAVIVPCRATGKGALRVALAQLVEQDPLINLRQDDVRQELYVSLYGEVRKEVIQATLANDFHLDVEFRETTTICVERPIGAGAAVEAISKAPNPFLATVGLRIEPAPLGAGVQCRRASEVLGTMPRAFFATVEETVRETLRQGLYGWPVTDCTVTMTHSGYAPRHSQGHQPFDKSLSSTGEDFRHLTPLVVMSALQQAGTRVYEPVHRFHLEVPADTLGPVLPVLARLGAVPQAPVMGGASSTLEGEIPAARVDALRQQLSALTRGEGLLESAFDHYQPVAGTIPTRPRTDHNPLNRKEYLLHITRRV